MCSIFRAISWVSLEVWVKLDFGLQAIPKCVSAGEWQCYPEFSLSVFRRESLSRAIVPQIGVCVPDSSYCAGLKSSCIDGSALLISSPTSRLTFTVELQVRSRHSCDIHD